MIKLSFTSGWLYKKINHLKTFFQQINNKNNQFRQIRYAQTTNKSFIPNIYSNNNTISDFYGITYANLKCLVENDSQFPLVYVVKNFDEEEEYVISIASYKINWVIQCENESSSFHEATTVMNKYIWEDQNPHLSQNCTWDKDSPKYFIQLPLKEEDCCGRMYETCSHALLLSV